MILLSIVGAVEAIAIVILFAMMAELAQRQTSSDSMPSTDFFKSMNEVALGARPSWPDHQLSVGNQVAVLVLSSVCGSCQRIASSFSNPESFALPLYVVAVGPSIDAARSILKGTQLESFPHYVDVGGTFASTELGVTASPCLLLIREHTIISAYNIGGLPAIKSILLSYAESEHRLQAS